MSLIVHRPSKRILRRSIHCCLISKIECSKARFIFMIWRNTKKIKKFRQIQGLYLTPGKEMEFSFCLDFFKKNEIKKRKLHLLPRGQVEPLDLPKFLLVFQYFIVFLLNLRPLIVQLLVEIVNLIAQALKINLCCIPR